MPTRRTICVAALSLSLFPALAADKRPIKADDIYLFHWVADPQVSPDGSQVAYTYVGVNAKHDGYDTSLWLVPAAGGAPRQITAGPRDSSARWSPNGKRIAFARATEKDGKPEPPQMFVLPMDGGEARQLTSLAKGAGSPEWSPDGRTIAFASTTNPKDPEKKDGDKKDDDKSDVRIINRAVYRFNGAGYNDTTHPSHIWTVEVPGVISSPGKATQVTFGEFREGDITWARDGSKIYFLSDRDLEPYYKAPAADLYAVSLKGGDPKMTAHVDGAIRNMAIDPSGARVSFVAALNGNPIRSHSQPDLWVASLEPGSTPKNLTTSYDFEIGSGVGGDQAPPRGGSQSQPFWSKDGRFVYVVSAEEGRANLVRVDAETGKVEPLTAGDHDVYSYSSTPDGSRVALAISTPTNIGDIFILDTASRQMRRLTTSNEKLFSELKLTAPETIWYQSFDGKRIQAWVQRPPDFDASKKYPLILNIHGGPHAAYGYTFDHEFQWMAAKGYIVLYPNPRGSTSYGQDFANIIQFHYPGDDFKDLMAGVDEVVKRGWADPDRMGVTGGSGGGVLTNWTVGHTDRFKAAVSQRSIADWRDFWYVADFSLFLPTWFRAAPWEDEADFKARSPITYIDKMKTPLMLIEGEADMRTPSGAGGEQMFRALKYRHVPTVMVQFPGETHELSRSGKPKHRVERLEHIVAWFDKYVNGQDIKTYDVQ
jgi:dipeptidyl aminopeptidase/acylaminoacyl peptidase